MAIPIWILLMTTLVGGLVIAFVIGAAISVRRITPILWSIGPFVALGLVVLGFVGTSHTHIPPPQVVEVRKQAIPQQAVSESALFQERAIPQEWEAAPLATVAPQHAVLPQEATIVPRATAGAGDPIAGDSASSPTVNMTEFVGSDTVGQQLTVPPGWVDEPRTDTGTPDLLRVVLASARFATVEEAEEELMRQARPLVASFLQRDGLDLPASLLTRQDLFAASAVTRRLHEQFQVQTRSHTEPVYRVTWQLWLRPAVAQSLTSTYLPRLTQERPWMLATGLGALTLLFGSWGAFYHFNESTLGRYRGKLAVAATGLSLVAGLIAAGLFV